LSSLLLVLWISCGFMKDDMIVLAAKSVGAFLDRTGLLLNRN
jgi:hypothetical protein